MPLGEAIIDARQDRESQRVYVTYVLSDLGGGSYVYVGRTSGFGTPEDIVKRRFYSHHMRVFGYGNPKVDLSWSGVGAYEAFRGREQQLYDSNYPFVSNMIRPVARGNNRGYDYWLESNYRFGQIAPYSGH